MHNQFDFDHLFLFDSSLHWIWPTLFWVLVVIAIIGAVKWSIRRGGNDTF